MLKFEIYKLIWLIIVIKPITNCVGTPCTVVSLDFVVFYKASSEKKNGARVLRALFLKSRMFL